MAANKWAVITGASSGIGFELAKELARRGYSVVVTSEDERLQGAAQEVRSLGVEVKEVQADLAKPHGVEQLWQEIEALGEPIDVACLNAGVGVGGLFSETELDGELNLVDLNCRSVVHLAKKFVQHMMETGTGRILITASIAGEMVAPREAVYAASKAFDLSFAHSLRYELRDTGITVTALQPGPTDTDFFHRAGLDNTKVGISGKRESQPDEVAKQGLDALFDGKDHVYAASVKTKMQGMVANLVPGEAKGAMHEKMARPLSGEELQEEREKQEKQERKSA